LEDEDSLARYLDHRLDGGQEVAPLRERPVSSQSLIAFGNLQAGYGKIFNDDSVITRRWAAIPREEAGYLFLKLSFRF
jgi:hypothetical protein